MSTTRSRSFRLPFRLRLAFACYWLRSNDSSSVVGDLYDFVSGDGVPAALIASIVKLAAAAQIPNATGPSDLLNGVNATLPGKTQKQFVTADYVYLDAEKGILQYSTAAHPAMLRLREDEVIKLIENGLKCSPLSPSLLTPR